MEITSIQKLQQAVKVAIAAKQTQYFPPIDAETRSHVATSCAAFHLSRKPQTMRAWACHEDGPLHPIRINGRLAWSVADIKLLLNGGKA